MFQNDDESEYQKIKTSENFNPKISQKKRHFSKDLYEDEEDMNDFFRFTNMININTLVSQPIIMYRKAKKLYSPKEEKREKQKPMAKSTEKLLVNNYIKSNFVSDGGLPQKLNKYKSKMINVHSQSPNNKRRRRTRGGLYYSNGFI